MTSRDYYADLEITQYATTSEIRSAFHALAKQHHPDKSGSNDSTMFRRVREAYETLSNITTKAAYDRTYQHTQPQYKTDDGPVMSRTAAYEAEEAARELRHEPPTRPTKTSPPPHKPVREPNEPSWLYYMSREYRAWEMLDAAYRQRHPRYDNRAPRQSSVSSAHGLHVQMSSHPSIDERCTLKTQAWTVQLAGSDSCIFCLTFTTGGSRCPGCQALACRTCLARIVEKERSSLYAGFN